jgi:hypothetical protein
MKISRVRRFYLNLLATAWVAADWILWAAIEYFVTPIGVVQIIVDKRHGAEQHIGPDNRFSIIFQMVPLNFEPDFIAADGSKQLNKIVERLFYPHECCFKWTVHVATLTPAFSKRNRPSVLCLNGGSA